MILFVESRIEICLPGRKLHKGSPRREHRVGNQETVAGSIIRLGQGAVPTLELDPEGLFATYFAELASRQG